MTDIGENNSIFGLNEPCQDMLYMQLSESRAGDMISLRNSADVSVTVVSQSVAIQDRKPTDHPVSCSRRRSVSSPAMPSIGAAE